MAQYRTCFNCAVDSSECARRDQIRLAVAGLSVTSIRFKCGDRQQLFRTGERVSVDWNTAFDEDNGRAYESEKFLGTVIKESGTRFVVKLDDDLTADGVDPKDFIKNEGLYIKVRPATMERVKQPNRPVCALCGIVGGGGFNACWQIGCNPHRDCMRDQMERQNAS